VGNSTGLILDARVAVPPFFFYPTTGSARVSPHVVLRLFLKIKSRSGHAAALSWKPDSFNIRSSDEIQYRVKH
jgi:hypothetical protein